MNSNVNEIKNVQEVIFYWRDCIAKFGSSPDTLIAGQMADIQNNSHFDDWYNNSFDSPRPAEAGNGKFVELFDLVSDLEITSAYKGEDRGEAWNRVKELLAMLMNDYK